MSNPSNAFELLLARANEAARFGTADNVECRDHQVMLNGLPYRAFRQSVRIDERRHQGTFFSGPSIARAIAEWIRPLIPTGGDRKSTRLNSSNSYATRKPYSAG